MSKKQKRILLPMALLLAALVALSGCRPSTALTRLLNASEALSLSTEEIITEDPDAETDETNIDTENNVEERDEDAFEEDMTFTVGQLMEELLSDETTADMALEVIYSVLAESDEWGTDEIDTESAVQDSETTELSPFVYGEAVSEDSTQAGGELTDGAEEEAAPGSTSNNSENESTNIQAQDEEPDDGEEDQTGGSNDDDDGKQLDDPDGDYVELETAEGQVAATGQLAILVSMLGGADRLCATSADYDENELAQKAFSGGDYEVLWSGDGSSPMSDEKFEKLLAMKPGLCVELSGYNTFSESQIERLEEAGITYAALPAFTSVDSIEKTVELLGDLLGDTSEDGGTNAPEIAADYLEWCENLEDSLDGALDSADAGAQTAVFIEDWAEDVQTNYTVYQYNGSTWSSTGRTILADTGAAVIRVGSLFRPLSGYLAYADVSDFSAAPTAYKTTYSTTSYLYKWVERISSSYSDYTLSGAYCCITPLSNTYWGTSDGSGLFWSQSASLTGLPTGVSCLYYANVSTTWNMSFGSVPGLGASGFTTVITRDSDTKAALESSWSWQTNATTSTSSGTKLTLSDDAEYVTGTYTYSMITGEYNVVVNPTGLGDWVDGSPESILESVWAAWAVQGCCTQEQVEAMIRDFYNTFYHYSLSESEMASILAGP